MRMKTLAKVAFFSGVVVEDPFRSIAYTRNNAILLSRVQITGKCCLVQFAVAAYDTGIILLPTGYVQQSEK